MDKRHKDVKGEQLFLFGLEAFNSREYGQALNLFHKAITYGYQIVPAFNDLISQASNMEKTKHEGSSS